jgi:hypothetical protein
LNDGRGKTNHLGERKSHKNATFPSRQTHPNGQQSAVTDGVESKVSRVKRTKSKSLAVDSIGVLAREALVREKQEKYEKMELFNDAAMKLLTDIWSGKLNPDFCAVCKGRPTLSRSSRTGKFAHMTDCPLNAAVFNYPLPYKRRDDAINRA